MMVKNRGYSRRRFLGDCGLAAGSVLLGARSTVAAAGEQAEVAKDATGYLFTSFRGNGEDGLHLAFSPDGL